MKETTVVVVEDDPRLVDLFTAVLEFDYHVRTATSDAEVLQHIDPTVGFVETLLERAP